MKKIILLLLIALFGASTAFSQSVNNVPIKDIDVSYIQIVGTAKFLSTKITIEIDFGQTNKLLSSKDTQVRDEKGKLVIFNSMIDALNFFSKNGYEFINAYVITINNQNVYHYMLKKIKE